MNWMESRKKKFGIRYTEFLLCLKACRGMRAQEWKQSIQ